MNPIVNNDPFTGAGTIGYVPNPGTATGLYLEDDGTWSKPLDTTDHTLLSNIGTNTHVQIDSHIANGSIHFTEASIDHTAIQNIGTNTHGQIDTHIGDATIHFTEASIDHGAIAGLADDDHTQYHTDARGDARYPIRDANFTHMVVTDVLPGTPDANTLYFLTGAP